MTHTNLRSENILLRCGSCRQSRLVVCVRYVLYTSRGKGGDNVMRRRVQVRVGLRLRRRLRYKSFWYGGGLVGLVKYSH